MISFRSSREPNVKKRVLVGITFPSFFSVTRFTPATPWSFSSSWISASDMSARSRNLIAPWEEFRVLWIETLTGLSINLFGVGFGPGPFCHTPPGMLLMVLATATLHQERSIPQPFNAFEGSSHCLQQRATVYSAGGHHSTTPRLGTLANWCKSCKSVHFQTPNPNLGCCSVIFFYLWVPCYVCERFITFCPHPPLSPTRGCTQAAFQQVRTRAQNAIYSGDKNKTKFTSIPWWTLSCCLLIEIRAKHDQPIDWVRPTQPPILGKSRPKMCVRPHRGPQLPGSHPPLTRDAAHGKHTGSEGDRREQEEFYKEQLYFL